VHDTELPAGVEASARESFYLFQYRVLVFLLFKKFAFVKYDKSARKVEIVKMSQMALAVGYRSYKVRKALRELERLHIIHDLKFAYNKASFYLEKVQLP
jgi:hypothetical protein